MQAWRPPTGLSGPFLASSSSSSCSGGFTRPPCPFGALAFLGESPQKLGSLSSDLPVKASPAISQEVTGLLRVCLSSIRELAQSHRDVEQELAHAVNASSKSMDRVYGKPRAAEVPAPSRPRPRARQPLGHLHGSVLVPLRG